MDERLKEIRKLLGLTQQEFADKLGIARGNISAYEVGKNGVSDSVVKLICNTFHVNENWLRYGTGDAFIELSRDEEIAEFLADVQLGGSASFKHKFITALSHLNADGWAVLEQIANELLTTPADDIDISKIINNDK